MCLVMLAGLLAGCANKDDEGPILEIYMDKTTNFDPAMAYNDQDASQFLSLVYDGLTSVDENGKVVAAAAKSWTVNGNVIEFKMRETRWSDGTYISASDFVYAWKRILDPEFECDAASLLFYVENAVEVKNGDTSIDDVKIEATGKDYLTVTLIDASYVDEFLYNCASVALYPLRSDAVSKITVHDDYYHDLLDPKGNSNLSESSWATLNAVVLANGPFFVKKIGLYESDGAYITLERNKYYLTDPEKNEAPRKFVEPYRINVRFVDPATAMDEYDAGTTIYNGYIPLAQREAYKDKAEISNYLATYSYMFNTSNPLFEKAEVRRALSLAIDRNEIEKLVVFGKAADGLVSPSVFYTTRKTEFRTEAGSPISTSADVAAAKQLLQQAGVTSGSFTLTVRNDEVSVEVANYVAGVWKSLGFNVTVQTLGDKSMSYWEVVGKDANSETGLKIEQVYTNLANDLYNGALKSSDFDVIGVDYAMLSTDAFSALARFGLTYSGGAYDFSESADAFDKVPGLSKYASTEYDELITSALKETDDSKRAAILVEAEKMLLNDMPIVPLYYMQNASISNKNLKGVETDYFGYRDFTDAKDSSYKYVPVEALIPSIKWN